MARVKGYAVSNAYTVYIALALGVVIASAVYIAHVCYTQYGTLFKVVGP
jgi:hypothetical protein